MRWLQNLDLNKKLILLAVVSGAFALLMACCGFAWHDLRMVKTSQLSELHTKAEILAIAGASAIASHDANSLQSLVDAVQRNHPLEAVGFFDLRGGLLASSGSNDEVQHEFELPARPNTFRYSKSGELELFHPVSLHGRDVAIVYLKTNLQEYYEQFISHLTMIFAVMLCSLALALVFAAMMQSLISKPILQLADAAQRISRNRDFTIRVSTESQGELGILYDSFNGMVQQIQSSQAELQLAREELENRVEQRTKQLQSEVERCEVIQHELSLAKDAAEASNRAKSRFLANMSHEIRTPLNGILGFTEFLLRYDQELRERNRRDYLRTIKSSGENLLSLINDILDLSKIEADRMEFECIPFSPDNIITEVISILKSKADEKDLKLLFQWHGIAPLFIHSDPIRFRQLMMNLIGNAIKFSESGSVNIIARVDRRLQKLHVNVIDTGIGIPDDIQQDLFNPFTQGDSSVTRRFGGTGLGLSICKNIVKGLGGEIHFTSQVGRGTTFSFEIDSGLLEENPDSPQVPLAQAANDSEMPHPVSLRSKRILVADDGATNRMLLELLLRRMGADVVLVENGLEAVASAERNDFDLILLDMQMPVLDGYSAARRLREAGFDKPIVALTAHAMRGDDERCLEAGCSKYLTKPIQQEVLLSTIASLMSVELPETTLIAKITPDQLGDPLKSELPIEQPPFAELVREFIVSAREKMSHLRAAQRSNDTQQMAKLAHWMKGTGGMAGFPRITEYARSLESQVNIAEPAAIESTLSDLEQLIGKLRTPEPA